MIMVGMVLGMLILLGAVLAVAMWLSTPDSEDAEKDARAPIAYNVEIVNSLPAVLRQHRFAPEKYYC